MRNASEAFFINHLDTLGQGVSKMPDGKIMLVPKTLPGESGRANIIHHKGKVLFCEAPLTLDNTSPDRHKDECHHYQQCSGCHFLHTDYQTELKFKSEGLKHLFKRDGMIISDEMLSVEPGPNRFEYRNRLQLHYDLTRQLIGMIDAKFNIVPIPECRLPQSKVKQTITQLYTDNFWMQLAQQAGAKNTGHVEIFERNNGEIAISWNERYASGGFEQVNPIMNKKLIQKVTDLIVKISPKNCLELFGGSGNLTQQALNLLNFKLLSVDYNSVGNKSTHLSCQFLNLDLYQDTSFEKIKKHAPNTIELLILDPPRSGLKHLNEYTECYSPAKILYVSCWPASLIRDVKSVSHQYTITSVTILDFFPGTHHFETLIELSRH